MFRLTEGGATVMDSVERGTPDDTAAVRGLLDRFVDAGALHPLPDSAPFTIDDVTFVVPCLGMPLTLPAHRTVVVDDASPQPVQLAAVPNSEFASLLRLEQNVGPGGARMAGLAHVITPLVAFVDADVQLPGNGADLRWLDPLLAHFADPRVAIVAPRVTSAGGHGLLARYETAFYRPLVSNWDNYDTWKERGGETAPGRANRIWKRLLADYIEPAMDPGRREAIAAFVTKRKETYLHPQQ